MERRIGHHSTARMQEGLEREFHSGVTWTQVEQKKDSIMYQIHRKALRQCSMTHRKNSNRYAQQREMEIP